MSKHELESLSWNSMIEKKYIKYIDVETSEHSVLAMTPNMLQTQTRIIAKFIHVCNSELWDF